MQKYILILLLISSPFVAEAMEVEEEQQSFRCCSSWRDYIPAWFTRKPHTQLQKLRADKNNFEKQLQEKMKFYEYFSIFENFCVSYEDKDFFKHCYTRKRHQNIWRICSTDIKVNKLLDQKARIDGYSAIGATILAKHLSANEKQTGVNKLLKAGFVLTENDKTLIRLELYEAIAAQLVPLFHDDQTSYFSVLPHDVRRCIVDYMICLFEKEEWLCVLLKQ